MPRPSDDQLRRFLLGTLPPAEAAAVEVWVAESPDAPSTLAGLDAADPLTATLSRAAAAPMPTEVEVERVVRTVVPPAGPSDAVPLAPPPAAAPVPPGGVIAGYRVVGELGRGGMGVVYEAADDRLGRRVALKVLAPGLAADPAARDRFLREARAAAAVDHDHIVPVYQVGEAGGVPFIAMPRLAGRTLDDRLAAGPVPVPEAVRVAREVADALAAAHAAGLVHRDVKPSNVWLEERPDGTFRRARVLDFGLARAAAGTDRLTGTDQVLGTPAYMAPEQAWGRPVDHRADLFGLGVVLYRMVTGELPFRGADRMALLAAVAVQDPAPPAAVNPAVPAALSALIVRLLAKDPAARPASAADVAAELDRIASLAPAPAAAPVRRRPRRAFAAAAGLLAAGLLALGGWVIVRVRDKDGKETVVKAPAGSTVTVGDDGSVTVDFRKPPPPSHPDAVARRKAFEWLLAQTPPPEVVAAHPDGRWQRMTSADPLPAGFEVSKLVFCNCPAATDDRLKALLPYLGGLRNVDVSGCTNLTDESLVPLARLPKVTRFQAGRLPGLTDRTLAGFAGHPSLTELGLDANAITAAGIAHLATAPNLNALGLEGLPVGDDWVAALAGCGQLEHLWLGRPRPPGRLTAAGLAHLARLPKLFALHLDQSPVDDDALAGLKNLTNLRSLSLGHTRITDAGLAHLAGLKRLSDFSLPSTGVHGEGFRHLTGGNLTVLNLHGCPVTPAGLAEVARLDTLSQLQIEGVPLSDESARRLAAMPALTHLGAGRSGITDEGLKALSGSKSLAELGVSGPRVTDAGVKHFAGRTELRVFSLPDTAITDASVPVLAGMKQLTWLNVSGTRVTPEGYAALRKALPKCHFEGAPPAGSPQPVPPGLAALRRSAEWVLANGGRLTCVVPGDNNRRVEVGDAKDLPAGPFETAAVRFLADRPGRLADDGVDQLAGLVGVRELVLQDQPLTDAGWAKVVKLPGFAGLADVNMTKTRLTAAAHQTLLGLPGLTEFHTSIEVSGPADLAPLADCPNLTKLSFHVKDVTAGGFAPLQRLKLKHLAVTGAGRLPAELLAAVAGIPDLKALVLYGWDIHDELTGLADVKALELLWVGRGSLSARAFAPLARCTQLAELRVHRGLPVTDEHLLDVARIPNLRTFMFEDSPEVTDRGLAALAAANKLTLVNFHGVENVTPAAVRALSAALPERVVNSPHGRVQSGRILERHPGWLVTPGQLDAHRKAAEWVARVGGGARYRTPTGTGGFPKGDAAPILPPEFLLTEVVILHGPKVTDADLVAHLGPLDTLVNVDLDDCPTVTDAGLAFLANKPRLETLRLVSMKTTDAGLEAVARCPELLQLDLQNTLTVTGAGFHHLARLPKLVGLNLDSLPLTDAHLEVLAGLPSLQSLTARGTVPPGRVTGAGLAKLGRHPTLRSLWLTGTAVDDAHLTHLSGAPNLEVLSLAKTRVTDAGLPALAAMPRLHTLDLAGTKVGGPGLAALGKAPALTVLQLNGCQLTPEGARGLLPAVKLDLIHIDDTRLTDEVVTAFAGLPALRQFHALNAGVTDEHLRLLSLSRSLEAVTVSGKGFTDGGVTHFRDRPRVTRLKFFHSNVSDGAFLTLREMKHLTHLDLAGSQVSPTGLGALRKALPKCEVLPATPAPVNLTPDDVKTLQWALDKGAEVAAVRYNDFGQGIRFQKDVAAELAAHPFADWHVPSLINFHRAPAVDAAGVELLAKLSHLNALGIDNSRIGDEGFAKLAKAPAAKTVRSLTIQNVGLTDAGAKHLAAFPAVERLRLNDNPLTPAATQYIRGLKNLRAVEWGCGLTDDLLGGLKGLTLTELHIDGSETLTDRGFAHVAGFPDLTFLYAGSPAQTDAGTAAVLPKLAKLDVLILAGGNTGPKTLAALGDVPRLRVINVGGVPLPDATLRALRLPATARDLNISGATGPVTDAGVAELEKFRQLTAIHIPPGPSLQAVERLSRALPGCRIRSAHGEFRNGRKQ